MKQIVIVLCWIVGFFPLVSIASGGMVQVQSQYGVDETASRFISSATRFGMRITSVIAQDKQAAQNNKTLRPTFAISYISPNIDFALMQCNQTVALDLPRSVVIWQNAAGQVWLAYNSITYIENKHNLRRCALPLDKISKNMKQLILEVTQPPPRKKAL